MSDKKVDLILRDEKIEALEKIVGEYLTDLRMALNDINTLIAINTQSFERPNFEHTQKANYLQSKIDSILHHLKRINSL